MFICISSQDSLRILLCASCNPAYPQRQTAGGGTFTLKSKPIGRIRKSERPGAVLRSFVFVQKPVDEFGGDYGSIGAPGKHGNAVAVCNGKRFRVKQLTKKIGNGAAGRRFPLLGNLFHSEEDLVINIRVVLTNRA